MVHLRGRRETTPIALSATTWFLGCPVPTTASTQRFFSIQQRHCLPSYLLHLNRLYLPFSRIARNLGPLGQLPYLLRETVLASSKRGRTEDVLMACQEIQMLVRPQSGLCAMQCVELPYPQALSMPSDCVSNSAGSSAHEPKSNYCWRETISLSECFILCRQSLCAVAVP